MCTITIQKTFWQDHLYHVQHEGGLLLQLLIHILRIPENTRLVQRPDRA